MFQMIESETPAAVIKVIGIGGGGGNAVAHMLAGNLESVEFVCANTDAQALRALAGASVLQLGGGVTKGLGAGANPEVGRQSALEDRERITEVLKGADMLFITAGMGGGTGTGAAPVIAQIAKDMGILTVAVVTKPFPFEGKRRMQVAIKGIEELSQHVDSLITIPNEKLLTVMGREVSLLNAFKEANKVLFGAVQGIAELITRPGLINVDFADVRTVMSEMGLAMMGTGVAKGDDRAIAATEAAIGNPLLEDVNLKGACGILVNVTAGITLTMREYDEIGRTVQEFASDDATIKIGTVLDPEMQDEIRVTVVATGLNRAVAKQSMLPESNVTVRPFRSVRSALAGNSFVEDLGIARSSSPAAANVGAAVSAPPARKVGLPVSNHAGNLAAASDQQYDYLDIPTFLRRQAD
jgi:cell division protein FtsZ